MYDGIKKIIQRVGGTTRESLITTPLLSLEGGKRVIGTAQENFQSKEDETKIIKQFVSEKRLWFDFNHFIPRRRNRTKGVY